MNSEWENIAEKKQTYRYSCVVERVLQRGAAIGGGKRDIWEEMMVAATEHLNLRVPGGPSLKRKPS